MRYPYQQTENMAADHEELPGPFYHGTRADLKPGDLVTPGYRSNYGHGRRTSAWVYMSGILSPWAAELALGDGPGRIYIVEPTGPFEDDPDLTDKRFAGNPTKSYRTRFPLRVVGEVMDWQGHSEEEIEAMLDALGRHRAEQAMRIACIPDGSRLDQLHAEADVAARDWAADSEYRGCTLLMSIRGVDVAVHAAMMYTSANRAETRVFGLPPSIEHQPIPWPGDNQLSGRVTNITAWFEGWAAVIESCVTEIGLSLETRVWIAADAMNDTLRFRVDAAGPERTWQRSMMLTKGVLVDVAQGEIWDFAAGSFES
jgi:hypothetical protein